MSQSVTVTTGARLHFGLLVSGEPGRRTYGGIGLMIDRPRFAVAVSRSDADRIVATPDVTVRIRDLLAKWRAIRPGGFWEIAVSEEIPAHAGLGSGTQLALAVSLALSRLGREPQIAVAQLAQRVGRSERSVIGTVGFERGGLIVQDVTSEVVRADFPSDWRFVLVTPPSRQGLSGESERQAFHEMPPMSEGTLQHLARLQTQLLSAGMEQDFATFSRGLYDFGREVGRYFTPFQSGVFADPQMAALADRLRAERIWGVGQTSWGPTLFAACESADEAESVVGLVARSNEGRDCAVRIVAGKNFGITVISDQESRTQMC